jgi:hypothetical protein
MELIIRYSAYFNSGEITTRFLLFVNVEADKKHDQLTRPVSLS